MASLRALHRSLAVTLLASLVVPLPVLAQDADPASMSDEDKLERAKQLYAEGTAALEADDHAAALVKFEQAYHDFAPDAHLFNYNIGVAARGTGDCIKAKEAFDRFLDLVPKHKIRKQAQQALLEIERSGCVADQIAAQEAEAERQRLAAEAAARDPDEGSGAPKLEARKRPGEDGELPEDPAPAGPRRPKLIAGSVLTGVGVAGLIGGAVSLGIANRRARNLAALSSPGATGFPAGDYSDDEIAMLDQRGLPAANGASVGLFVGGGVLAAVGVTLIVLELKGKAAVGAGENARRRGPRLTGLGPSVSRRGAGASATLRF